MHVFLSVINRSFEVPARESHDEVFPNHVFHAERCPPTKLRRRGPRSLQAIVRRHEHRFTALTVAPGESGAAPVLGAPVNAAMLTSHFPCPPNTLEYDSRRLRVNQLSVSVSAQPNAFCERVRVWNVNCCKLLKRKAELEARLCNSCVDILCLQETWLSEDVESIAISGYNLVGRLDRVLGPKRGYGGIAVFVRTTLADIALVEYVSGAERMWCVLHTNLGALLIGNWYRPPDDDGRSAAMLQAEIERLRCDCVGVILVGDINIHHKRWLKHSHSNTEFGERLWEICRDVGLKQIVAKPTRGEYLLDLVFTDAPELCKVEVLPEISDHRVVSLDIEVVVSYAEPVQRTVWNMRDANWENLRRDISRIKWRDLLDDLDPEASVQRFCSVLQDCCCNNIPPKAITAKTASHPWLDDACFAAVAAKATAGSSEFADAARHCREVLREAFLAYRRDLRERILALPRHSKDWWRLNKELLYRRSKAATIPPLKEAGDWVLDPREKANALAKTFQTKSSLPPPAFGPKLDVECVATQMPEFTLIRARLIRRIIKALKLNTASGPDGLPVRVFRECCDELAPAIAVLVRFLIRIGFWPQPWRFHRIQPLYKKGAVSSPSNYRGVHLTNIIAKIVERALATVLVPHFDRAGAFGRDQWGFRKMRSCRDLVTLLVCRWIWALDNGFKVGIYLSDISGAFDRVDRELLADDFRRYGVSECLFRLLYSYLAPREASVVVQGCASSNFTIEDEVFQGTVLGPPLWNVFFRDIDDTILQCLFRIAKFAGDLTAYRNYCSKTSNVQIEADLKSCQQACHHWGVARRVTFDPAKEHFCILHKLNCAGDTFRLLGVLVDPRLNMYDEIQRIRKKARPKIRAILNTRAYYDTLGLLQQYKAHVLCLLGQSALAIFHAAQSHLESLNRIQRSFVQELGLTEAQAFLQFKLAPLELRRDIAALGLLHKIQLGEAHLDFDGLFPKAVHVEPPVTRHGSRRHGRQFAEISGNSFYFNHSVFGMTKLYNILPEYAVACSTVSSFQAVLTKDARMACQTGRRDWKEIYRNRHYGWH